MNTDNSSISINFPDKKHLEVNKCANSQKTALNTIWDAADLGIDIFHAAIAALVAISDSRWITISLLNHSKDSVDVKAMWDQDHFVSCFQYDLKDTPCDLVTQSENIMFFDNVADKFPEDEYLIAMGVKEYLGLSFKNIHGDIIGHISLMDQKPFVELKKLESILSSVCVAVSLEMK